MAKLRDKTKIKTDIEAAGVITRNDVWDVFQHSKDKDKKDKKKDIEDFIDTLPTEIKDKKEGNKTVKEKILDDLDSYPI